MVAGATNVAPPARVGGSPSVSRSPTTRLPRECWSRGGLGPPLASGAGSLPWTTPPPEVPAATAGCPPCAELSRAALDQRSAGLTGWAMVLPWQRIGNGMVRVVQRVAEGREPWADWRAKSH